MALKGAAWRPACDAGSVDRRERGLGRIGEFVCLPGTVVAAALVWLLLAGPGRVSLDALLRI